MNDIGTIFQKTWGPERTVEIFRDSPEAGLGISIVGGRVESINPSEPPSKSNPSKDSTRADPTTLLATESFIVSWSLYRCTLAPLYSTIIVEFGKCVNDGQWQSDNII